MPFISNMTGNNISKSTTYIWFFNQFIFLLMLPEVCSWVWALSISQCSSISGDLRQCRYAPGSDIAIWLYSWLVFMMGSHSYVDTDHWSARDRTWPGVILVSEFWVLSSDAVDMSYNVRSLLLPTPHWSHACYVHTAIIKFYFYI